MALLAEHPTDRVHHIGLTTTVWTDNAGRAIAAKRHYGAFAKGFKAYDFDFAQLEQVVPFCREPLVRAGPPRGQPQDPIPTGPGVLHAKRDD